MLNLSLRGASGKASAAEPLFSSVNVAEERRARSWLDARISDGRKGQFTEERPVMITPTLAEVMIERNTENRALSRAGVEKYRRALREGRWQTTHQGIAFDNAGVLRDGQHRLNALIEEGRSALMTVTFGVDPASFVVMDTGIKRTAAHVLDINKRGGRNLSAMARAVMTAKSAYPRSKRALDNDEIDQFVAKNRKLTEFYDAAAEVRATLKTGVGLMAGLFLVYEAASPVRMADFITKLRTGTGFEDKRDPILVLRDCIRTGVIQSSRPLDMAAAVVLAWNLSVRGRPAKTGTLRWTDQEFPKPERV